MYIKHNLNIIFMNINNITNIDIMINRKIGYLSIYFLFFFMLLAVTYFVIFPKHNIYGFISESFALI